MINFKASSNYNKNRMRTQPFFSPNVSCFGITRSVTTSTFSLIISYFNLIHLCLFEVCILISICRIWENCILLIVFISLFVGPVAVDDKDLADVSLLLIFLLHLYLLLSQFFLLIFFLTIIRHFFDQNKIKYRSVSGVWPVFHFCIASIFSNSLHKMYKMCCVTPNFLWTFWKYKAVQIVIQMILNLYFHHYKYFQNLTTCWIFLENN
jgi:hypothetical protein